MSEKFERDLNILVERLSKDVGEGIREGLISQKERLVELKKQKKIVTHHSVLELVCSKQLLLRGYEVEVEHPLTNILVCDVYGEKDGAVFILEIESGFIPPKYALYPEDYQKARITSKIARYSKYADKFGLVSPPGWLLRILPLLLKPPRDRSTKEIESLKDKCDEYYTHPYVTFDELKYARLHTVWNTHVDKGIVREFNPLDYYEMTKHFFI